jgi:hypothetical protein
MVSFGRRPLLAAIPAVATLLRVSSRHPSTQFYPALRDQGWQANPK